MAANEQKCLRLCLMLEGTSLLARDWDDIKATYIVPLLQGVAKAYHQRAECAVVVYRTRAGCNSQDIVQHIGWTSDFSRLLAWMENFEPRGGGSMEAAFTEGLAEAIYLFTRPSRCVGRVHVFSATHATHSLAAPELLSKHLFFVAAGNAHRQPIPWPVPTECKSAVRGAVLMSYLCVTLPLQIVPKAATYTDLIASMLPRGVHLNCIARTSADWVRPQFISLVMAREAQRLGRVRTVSRACCLVLLAHQMI